MKKFLILLLVLPVLAIADSGSITKYLVAEPANLMDLGLLRLDAQLNAYVELTADSANQIAKTEVLVYGFDSAYNLSTDRIDVKFNIVPVDKSKADFACRNLLTTAMIHVVKKSVPKSFGHLSNHHGADAIDASTSILEKVDLYCEAADISGRQLAQVSAVLGTLQSITLDAGGDQ